MGLLINRNDSDDSNTDNNCGHHHYPDEYTEQWNDFGRQESELCSASEDQIPSLLIQVGVNRQCMHEGCTETDRGPVSSYFVPKAAFVAEGEFSKEDGMKEYAEQLRELADKFDPEKHGEGDSE